MFPALSMAGARRLVLAGGVRVDGRVARKGDRLVDGQVVEVEEASLVAPTGTVPPDDAIPLEVLYSDDALVAIDKRAGIPSHPLRLGETGTVANALVARFPECAAASPDPREGGLGHRRDAATSGVLIAARRLEVWRSLRAALGGADCEKTYLAEVLGAPSEAGAIAEPIGRVGRRGARVRVGAGRAPLPARSAWEVVERRAQTALVRVRLHVGRAHQVRAHLSSVGHPLVGDPKYGGPEAPLLHLHALAVRFRHPTTGLVISIEAPPPGWAKMRA